MMFHSLKYGVKLISGGSEKEPEPSTHIEKHQFLDQKLKLVNPMKDRRIWISKAKNLFLSDSQKKRGIV